MHASLERLVESLRLRAVEPGVYEAAHPTGLGAHLFGGQVLAQGLAAAHLEAGAGAAQLETAGRTAHPGIAGRTAQLETVSRTAHSLHAYFLARGNPQDTIRLEVTELRRSRTFHTLEVRASQKGEGILRMSVSHHDAESGPTHQIPMDDVGPPQGEAYERALLRAMTPAGFEDDDTPFELPVEIRGVGGIGLFTTEVKPPQARCWMRVRGPLPDDAALHQCLFAYASDYAIMAPALNPHPVPVTALQSASLDHAVWFHRPFRMDEWLLFELDSPVASGARGVGRGLLYTRDGELVASCVQESLLRPRKL